MDYDEGMHGEQFPKPGRFLGDRTRAREPDEKTIEKAHTLATKSGNSALSAAKLLDPYRLNHSLPIDHLAEGEQPRHIFVGTTSNSYFMVSNSRILNMGGKASLMARIDPNQISRKKLNKQIEELGDKDLVQAVAFTDLTDFVAKSGITSLKFKYNVTGDSAEYSYSVHPTHHNEGELFSAEEHVLNRMSTTPIQSSITTAYESQENVSAGSPVGEDPLKEIERLAHLEEAGSISKEEFEAKKEKILENL